MDELVGLENAYSITYKKFLDLYTEAQSKNDWSTLSFLETQYKSYFIDAVAAETAHNEPSDNEDAFPCPILSDTDFFTYRRIMNIITYLIGSPELAEKYRYYLEHVIAYKLRTNSDNKTYRCYDSDSLWKEFFLHCATLAAVIRQRKIIDIDELVYRTQEYFENAPFDYSFT